MYHFFIIAFKAFFNKSFSYSLALMFDGLHHKLQYVFIIEANIITMKKKQNIYFEFETELLYFTLLL